MQIQTQLTILMDINNDELTHFELEELANKISTIKSKLFTIEDVEVELENTFITDRH